MKFKNQIKKILYKIGIKNSKEFNTYHEALKFCTRKTKKGYQSEILSRYRFEKCQNFLNSDHNLLNSIVAFRLIHSFCIHMKNNSGKLPNFIDFGGACGEYVYMLSRIFGEDIFKKAWIIESPQQVKESKNWEFSKKLNFSSDLESVIKTKEIDLFFSAGCIKYTDSPQNIIEIISKSRIPLIVLSRNNFSRKKRIISQVSNLSSNGTGKHIKSYGNPRIFYPNTSLIKKDLIKIFESQNYRLIEDIPEESGIIDFSNHGGDLIFQAQNG